VKYYPFHVGDYAAHTRHLTPLEDLAYRRMLDWYYLQERPLNECPTVVARQVGLPSNEAEVKAVLGEFFVLVEGRGWTNKRVEDTLQQYRDKSAKAAKAGLASAARRQSVPPTDVQQPSNERSTDVEQTSNQPKPKPKPEKREYTARSLSEAQRPDSVPEALWINFVQLRRAKRAPLTSGALRLIEGEAQKAGWELKDAVSECVLRGWVGFKAEWVAKKTSVYQKPVTHMPNMPLGSLACACTECVAYRTKRGGSS